MKGMSKASGVSKAVTVFLLFFLMCLPLGLLIPAGFLNVAHDDAPRTVDMVAVLFNDFHPSGNRLNNETKRRIHYGLSLVKRDKVKYLLVSGGSRPDKEYSGAELMVEYIQRIGGIEDERIIVENKSRDSVTNLENISRKRDELSLTSVGLVSSPLHLLRIQSTSKDIRDNFYYFPYDAVSCTPSLSRKEIWYSVHYNLAAYIVSLILPASWYDFLVQWIREHTEL